ncbi:MAG: DUF4097 family beta strand repeat-containing protein [Ruminococcus sp.]
MTTAQKVIKYLAMALAIFLCVSLIGTVVTVLAGVSHIFTSQKASSEEAVPVGEMQVYRIDDEISSLSLELSAAKLKISTADEFSVESNHNYISVNTENGKLCINETKKLFSEYPKGITVNIYVPDGLTFDDAKIETGAGAVRIDALSSDVLDISLGAGETKIKNLTANSRADIDGGAGALTIDGGLLRNLDLDMGVGKLTLKSRVEGESSIDCGVGEIELTLLGSREDYQIELDKGIGEAKLDKETMRDDSVYGFGRNRIDIDGGIGAINIEFSK